MNNEKAKEILVKSWKKLSDEEKEEFLTELSDKEISLLEDGLWDEKDTKEALRTIGQELLSFKDQETDKIKKKKVISIIGSSAISGALAGLLDIGIGGATGGVITGAVIADLYESMMEEDAATRKVFRTINRYTFEKITKLFKREKDCYASVSKIG